MLVSAALMDYNPTEQAYILKAIEEDTLPESQRLHTGVMKVMEAFDAYEPTVEGYAGFKVDRNTVSKKKAEYKDDRNVGRVVRSGSGDSMLITGKKADGRYIVVGKKGEKSARDAADLGVTTKEEVVGIDIDDLHQEMLEGLKQARKNVGASKCWDGYKASGTKKKGGKDVPNCVKEEELDELYKGKHGQSEKQYQDGRSDAGKMVSGDSKMSGSKYAQGRRTGSDAGPQPAGGSKKPASQGKMDSGSRTDLVFRKAALKKKAAEMKEDASMTPQEIQLQKKKAMLDRMIAQRRQQGLTKTKATEAPAKAMGEETEDSLKDRRMERGGVDGNNRYKSATKNVAMGGGKKKPYDGMSALEKVKASIRAKHGQGAIMDTKKK